MDAAPPCRLAHHLAARLRAQRDELTRRWLDRIAARVTLDPNRIFPTDDLLNHVPVLIDAVADYPEDPTEEVATDAPAVAKAIELGELRFAQGFDTAEILKEFEILGGILFHFLVTQVDSIDEPCSRSELLACAHRLFRTLAVIQYVTTTHFLQKVGAQVAERENRLRRFNRLVSHELKNHIHTARGALEALAELGPDAPEAAKFVDMARRHLKRMGETLEDLLELTRLADDPRRHRNVELPEAVAEAVRQVREAAQAQGIEIRLAEDLPRVEVHAAAVELCLTNYLSNAIKYADPAKSERWIDVRGWIDPNGENGPELVVAVRDNGLGVPVEARDRLFQRFERAHEGFEGTGLGLSLVRETVESFAGRAWAEHHDDGTTFLLALPCRRTDDRGDPA